MIATQVVSAGGRGRWVAGGSGRCWVAGGRGRVHAPPESDSGDSESLVHPQRRLGADSACASTLGVVPPIGGLRRPQAPSWVPPLQVDVTQIPQKGITPLVARSAQVSVQAVSPTKHC